MLILLTTLILTASCHPIQDGDDVSTTTELFTDVTTTDSSIPENIQKDVNIIAYIQNFKESMVETITKSYDNFTIHELEQVKDILEDFLIKFAKDLREAVERQHKNEQLHIEYEKIDDNVPEESYQVIQNRLQTEFPDINEETAKEIVYRLRRNLLETKRKIASVIESSKQAQLQYDSIN